MAVLLDASARVAVIGATGAYGRAQVQTMRQSGTIVVASVSAGRGGEIIDDVPAFDTVAEAVAAAGADTAMVYTPAAGARDALIECAEAGIRLAAVAAEFVPVHDTLEALAVAREHGMWVVGPNSLGMISPGAALLGSIAPGFARPGRIGVIGRSGTLTLTTTRILSQAGIGQSTAVHIGGDMMAGRNPHEWLQAFLADPATDAVAYLGEIGGGKEYAMLDVIAAAGKPVVALVVGRHAPPGKRMGHAGALIGADRETAAAKRAALAEAGARVAESPMAVATLLAELTR
ncbi:MAG: succinate--CoA ligase subunit alpha [Ferrovibrionaceae bacterium]